MNAILDRVLVGAALLASVLYCACAFGPREWRRRLSGVAAAVLTRVGLRRLARGAASAASATPGPCGACAGCVSASRRSLAARKPADQRAGATRSG